VFYDAHHKAMEEHRMNTQMNRTATRALFNSLGLSELAVAEGLGISRTKVAKELRANPTKPLFFYGLQGLKNAQVTDDFTGRLVGSSWTDKIARAAIPAIVAAARAGERLTYRELDERIHDASPGKFGPSGTLTKFGRPLGQISYTCDDMRSAFNATGKPKLGDGMPPITAIIISASTGLPGAGYQYFTDNFMAEIDKSKKAENDPDWAIEYLQKQVFEFKGWDALIEAGQKAESITAESEDYED
jgi:hypothetical protein